MTEPVRPRAALPSALQLALDAALDLKAQGPVVLHVTEIAGYTDYVLLLSGRSDRHVRGITEAIVDALRAAGHRPLGTDGLDEHLWDLLDYDDFIVHVFYHPVRVHYDLEGMWRDATRIELGLDPEVMDVSNLGELPAPEVMPGRRGGDFSGFVDELGEDDEDDDLGEDDFDDDFDDADFDDADDEFADELTGEHAGEQGGEGPGDADRDDDFDDLVEDEAETEGDDLEDSSPPATKTAADDPEEPPKLPR